MTTVDVIVEFADHVAMVEIHRPRTTTLTPL
jgi:hypothetical protein